MLAFLLVPLWASYINMTKLSMFMIKKHNKLFFFHFLYQFINQVIVKVIYICVCVCAGIIFFIFKWFLWWTFVHHIHKWILQCRILYYTQLWLRQCFWFRLWAYRTCSWNDGIPLLAIIKDTSGLLGDQLNQNWFKDMDNYTNKSFGLNNMNCQIVSVRSLEEVYPI